MYAARVKSVRSAAFVAVALACALVSTRAQADITHTVARGHTLDAIAHRYHVAPKAIVDANHLRDQNHLRVGQTLVIPGVNPPTVHVTAPGPAGHGHAQTPAHPVTYAARPKTPGVVHLKRLATAEEVSVRVSDRRGRLPPPALAALEHALRYPSGLTHPIDARLVSLLGVVSNHFGSRAIEIISGFRPYSPAQYTAHSNHNVGHAVDFRVVGVPNEVVRDFCRTLRNTGCGYYPNSVFVHMDTRASSAYWVDLSRPGERPRYSTPSADADEGTSDVGDENHLSAAASEPTQDPATPTTQTQAAPPAADGVPMNGSDLTPNAPAQ